MGDIFSKREGLTVPAEVQQTEINKRTRNRIIHVLTQVHQKVRDTIFWQNVTEELHNKAGLPPIKLLSTTAKLKDSGEFMRYLAVEFVPATEWYHIFDLFEILKKPLDEYARKERYNSEIRAVFDSEPRHTKSRFEPQDMVARAREEYLHSLDTLYTTIEFNLNSVLADENVAWVLENGKFRRTVEQIGVIRNTSKLLKEENLPKAKIYFDKAWNAFNQRPNTDLDGCMRNAWDAVEIVAKYCAGLKGGEFGKALPKLVKLNMVHEDWKSLMNNFYGIACSWVRHPSEKPSSWKIKDAELFMIISAQIISYILQGYREVKNKAITDPNPTV